jgi:hypothetical protein
VTDLSRRRFIEYATSASAVVFGGVYTVAKFSGASLADPEAVAQSSVAPVLTPDSSTTAPLVQPATPEQVVQVTQAPVAHAAEDDVERQRMLEKVQRFDENLVGDLWLEEHELPILLSMFAKIGRVKDYVGYGHFNILSFDSMLNYSKSVPSIGAFTKAELELLEKTFYRDATELGFMGKKVVTSLTNQISRNEVSKIPGSGHYLFKGESEHYLNTLQKKIGDEMILTSGVRSVVKQYQLYLQKVIDRNGNLSRASRSLAPPGYSFHASGDFDVGQRGYGKLNFTARFEESDVYKKLMDLGIIEIRYPEDNMLGVRYEPWHIQMSS